MGDGAIIFGRKQRKERKKKVIASTDVRFSAKIQVKSKKKSFSHRSKGRMVIIYKEMVYSKMGMVLFSGGMASPINSSTAYNPTTQAYSYIYNTIVYRHFNCRAGFKAGLIRVQTQAHLRNRPTKL